MKGFYAFSVNILLVRSARSVLLVRSNRSVLIVRSTRSVLLVRFGVLAKPYQLITILPLEFLPDIHPS